MLDEGLSGVFGAGWSESTRRRSEGTDEMLIEQNGQHKQPYQSFCYAVQHIFQDIHIFSLIRCNIVTTFFSIRLESAWALASHIKAMATLRPFSSCLRSEEHTSELQSRQYLVCRLLLEKKKKKLYEVKSS